ncbi:MAG: hypothetical protein R2939_14845 [Kofleriaceae bacterium]
MRSRHALSALFGLVAGCGSADSVTLVQYTEAPAPVVGGGVKLWLGDVSGGASAEVRVLAPDGAVLAQGYLARGDELGFSSAAGRTRWWRWATRIRCSTIAAPCGSRRDRRGRRRSLRLPQRSRTPLPGVAGVDVEFDDITEGTRALIRIRTSADDGVLAERDAVAGDTIPFAWGGASYVVRVVAYEDHAVHTDYALIRVERP